MSRVLYVRSMLRSGSPQYWLFNLTRACVVFAALLGILCHMENGSLGAMNNPTLQNTTMVAFIYVSRMKIAVGLQVWMSRKCSCGT